jgi:hypothetical protein
MLEVNSQLHCKAVGTSEKGRFILEAAQKSGTYCLPVGEPASGEAYKYE